MLTRLIGDVWGNFIHIAQSTLVVHKRKLMCLSTVTVCSVHDVIMQALKYKKSIPNITDRALFVIILVYLMF